MKQGGREGACPECEKRAENENGRYASMISPLSLSSSAPFCLKRRAMMSGSDLFCPECPKKQANQDVGPTSVLCLRSALQALPSSLSLFFSLFLCPLLPETKGNDERERFISSGMPPVFFTRRSPLIGPSSRPLATPRLSEEIRFRQNNESGLDLL